MFSPLEQFEIRNIITFSDYLELSITQATLFLWFVFVLIVSFFYFGLRQARLIPKPLQYFCEQIYMFIIAIIKQQTGNAGLRYFPVIFTIFIVILFSNLIGLIPFAFAPTSQIALTFSLAFSCNIAFFIIGYWNHGNGFFNIFVPKGVPKQLFHVIVFIEVVSYILRTFSLSIRLFANIMAGHTLLHILSSFVVAFLFSYAFLAPLPLLLLIAIIGLEVAVAVLQAYVFTILICIYLNDSLRPWMH
jgi:F-type H+-transporting ATPase subunit a